MKTTKPDPQPASRIEREIERERDQRHKNDEERSGTSPASDFRIKDARESSDSGALHRSRSRYH
ncbi:hypothetical protein CR152_19855 [Massilia violaceinigra]|uniref:Uncharacterized protein n=1 Tax=Massilia violaceinigra TaxID=2045208 RepID=A0A2D2DNH6_9BURK|nr:hypothetical protein [Massilia violaceinigra]ATQ76517.1 hypothetical protein CR152_19855 [Massilia violaceinigra]